MASNSKIFTTSIFGNSSANTAANLSKTNTSTIQSYYSKYPLVKMNNTLVKIPSNQTKVKGT